MTDQPDTGADLNATSKLIMDALAHAVAGQADQAATALQTIGSQTDGAQMYGVCCALAGAGVIALRRIYGDRAPKHGSGDMWVLEQLKPGALSDDPPKSFAIRFLVAYANGDTDTALALYDAAYEASDEQYIDSVCALLANVAGITRLALGQQKDDDR